MKQPIIRRQGLHAWLTLLRLGPTARGILPFLLGATIAWAQGAPINWAVLVISTIGVICVMEMTFLINDYYDYGADVLNRTFHRLSGGSRILPSGLLPQRSALNAAYACILIAGIIGLILQFYYKTGLYTIPLGVLAMFIGYFYTAKPLRFSYHGLGEIAIWFSCGWLAILSGYYLQTGHFDSVATLVSFPGATSVFLVILANEIPDMASDRQVGKRNLAVRLGRERTAWLYNILLALCYLSMIAIVFFEVPKVSALLSLVILPFIVINILTVAKRGFTDENLEGLSIKITLIDHLITIVYTVSFVIVGWGLELAAKSALIIIGVLFLLGFVLEGLSFVSARALREHIK